MTVETEVGLVELHYRRGAPAAALALTEPLIPLLPTGAATGWDNPIRVCGVCVQVLRAADDLLANSAHRTFSWWKRG